MGQQIRPAGTWSRALFAIAGLLALLLLFACGGAPASDPYISTSTTSPLVEPSTTAEPLAPSPTALPAVTATITPAPAQTPTPSPSKTPFSRSLEHYRLKFDQNATPRIPPSRSISMPIWWEDAIPATPIAGDPRITNHPAPAGLTTVDPGLLAQAGCGIQYWYDVECSAESPLSEFNCSEVIYPDWIYDQAQHDLAVVAACWQQTEDWEATPGPESLHLTGCAFRRKVGYIFRVGDAYLLVTSHEDLRRRFVPIESEAEAISYAQLMTGLEASFGLSIDDSLLYLREDIEDTHAVKTEEGYRVNLYHHPGCFCEPYIYSEVILQVTIDGQVTWLNAAPYALTTGFGCAD